MIQQRKILYEDHTQIYYQVQEQLYITSRSWRDLVVWTPSYTPVERIWFDTTYLMEQAKIYP